MTIQIRVTHFQRKPPLGFYSVERIFDDIRAALPPDINVTVHRNLYQSLGLLRRFIDSILAIRYQGQVNHVTGDVHYLVYFLDPRRTILTILDCVSLERQRGIKRWLLWVFWYWLPEKRCALITVISDSAKQQLLQHLRCNPSKIRVIHCPVSSEFKPIAKPFNRDHPRLLQVGTTDNKNIPRLAQALKGLPCLLVVVGILSDLQRESLRENQIDYEAHECLSRYELLEQYYHADILMFVSLYEGFGLPIVEANAIGRPVITSNLYSMPEVGGDSALYVDPFSPSSIRAALDKIISNPLLYYHLSSRGLSNSQRFHCSRISGQYAEVYRDVYNRSLAG